MTASDLKFPVICIYKNTIVTFRTQDELTSTTTAALRSDLFYGLRIVDSSGKEYTVKNVEKLQGIGPFWGYNVFLNRTVRIDLEINDDPKALSVDDVRRLVIGDFQEWHGWKTRENFNKLKSAVEKAPTVAEIIRLICS